MIKIENSKEKQVNDMVSLVKLASLFFTAIVVLQNIFNENKVIYGNMYGNEGIIAIGVGLSSCYIIYWVWSTIINKKDSSGIKSYSEAIFFLSIFTVVIIISGAHSSEYKFIFLFIITTTTIQQGFKRGMTIASISSLIVLITDIVYYKNENVNHYFENDLILVGVFILTAWTLGYYVKIEHEYGEELQNLANKDGLTGTFNHRYFHEALEIKVNESKLSKRPVSLLFIDIDYFKHYNDLYGHQAGDKLLKQLASLLRGFSEGKYIVSRYGGEEFAIILPNTSEEFATIFAEELRNKIESEYFEGQENQPNETITVSIGISVFPDKADSDINLIKSADDALYRAKFFNKNRVETYISILDELKSDIDEKDIELFTSFKTLISVINAKDRYTYAHSERLVFYSKLYAEYVRLNEEDKDDLIYAAYMHDIGKINISKDILIKKMPLTVEEWNTLKQHPENGVEIIKSIKSLEKVAPIILHHHEKYDGTGYPCGLKGNEIPYLARVITVIDSFDAMTSNRPYNKRKTYAEGIEELQKYSGIQFDPKIATDFIETIKRNKDKLD